MLMKFENSILADVGLNGDDCVNVDDSVNGEDFVNGEDCEK